MSHSGNVVSTSLFSKFLSHNSSQDIESTPSPSYQPPSSPEHYQSFNAAPQTAPTYFPNHQYDVNRNSS
jgi:hypothetical protein